jgi:hypothetical protein
MIVMRRYDQRGAILDVQLRRQMDVGWIYPHAEIDLEDIDHQTEDKWKSVIFNSIQTYSSESPYPPWLYNGRWVAPSVRQEQ